MKSKKKHRGGHTPRAASRPAGGGSAPAAPPPASAPAESAQRACVPRRPSTLVRRIFAKNDPVDVATALLKGERDSTAGRVYLQLLEYLYGRPGQPAEPRSGGEEQIEYQFVSSIPRPQYPPRQAAAATPPANVTTTAPASTGFPVRSSSYDSNSD